MKRLVYLLIALSLMLALLPVAASAHSPPLMWKEERVGTVIVWNDDENLYVRFMSYGCDLDETHLHVATSLGDIPQANGNPIPGQFDEKPTYYDNHIHDYEISLSDRGWGDGQQLYIAAHAVVCCEGVCDTAWGLGCKFPGRKWAYCITYKIEIED